MTSHFGNFHTNSDPTPPQTLEPTGWWRQPWWTVNVSFFLLHYGWIINVQMKTLS